MFVLQDTGLQNGLVGSPCSPRDSQESSPTPQSKSIKSLVLSLLHSAAIHGVTKSRAQLSNWTELNWFRPCCCCSVAKLCPALCNPMDFSMLGSPVLHYLAELAQTHAHQVGDVIQPSHPLSSPSPPAFNLSQHQGLFQWVSSSHQVAKVLEIQLQHQFF